MGLGYKTLGCVAIFCFGGAAHSQSVGADNARNIYLILGLLSLAGGFWKLSYGRYAENGRIVSALKKLGLSGQKKDFWGRYRAMPVRLQNSRVESQGLFGYLHHFSVEMENPAKRSISWPEIYKSLPFELEKELDQLLESWQNNGVSLHLVASAAIIKVTFKIHFGLSDLIGSEDLKQLQRTFELLNKIHVRLRSMMMPSTASPVHRPDLPNPTFF